MHVNTVVVLVAMSLPLSACAGSLAGDALAGPEKLAQQDDAYCTSIGAPAGTPAYTQCRMFRTQERDVSHARGLAAVEAGAALAATPPIQPAPMPRNYDCTSTVFVRQIMTQCQ
jgi:hypothetical protein